MRPPYTHKAKPKSLSLSPWLPLRSGSSQGCAAQPWLCWGQPPIPRGVGAQVTMPGAQEPLAGSSAATGSRDQLDISVQPGIGQLGWVTWPEQEQRPGNSGTALGTQSCSGAGLGAGHSSWRGHRALCQPVPTAGARAGGAGALRCSYCAVQMWCRL